MKHIKWFVFPAVLLIALSFVVSRTTFAAHAVPASKCTGWKIVASPNADSGNDLLSVAAISANDVWAVGSSTNKQGTLSQTLTEHWNGSKWSIVSSPNVGSYSNVLNGVAAVSSTDVWAVGTDSAQTMIEHWDGTKWNVVASPGRGVLSGIAVVSANDIWAVGNLYHHDGSRTLIEQWNGTKWSIVPSPNHDKKDYLSSVTVVSATDVWAVGDIPQSSVRKTLIEQWNGSAWNIVSSPNPPKTKYTNFLQSVSAVSANDIWAVGYRGSAKGGLIEQWNGTSWTTVKPAKSGLPNTLRAVVAIASNNVWIVGSGKLGTFTEHWNGKQWNHVSSPNPPGLSPDVFQGIAQVPNTQNLWSVGTYEVNDSQLNTHTLIEYYCG
jgi:hypothetical protein